MLNGKCDTITSKTQLITTRARLLNNDGAFKSALVVPEAFAIRTTFPSTFSFYTIDVDVSSENVCITKDGCRPGNRWLLASCDYELEESKSTESTNMQDIMAAIENISSSSHKDDGTDSIDQQNIMHATENEASAYHQDDGTSHEGNGSGLEKKLSTVYQDDVRIERNVSTIFENSKSKKVSEFESPCCESQMEWSLQQSNKLIEKIRNGHFGDFFLRQDQANSLDVKDDSQSFGKGWWNTNCQNEKVAQSKLHHTNDNTKLDKINQKHSQKQEEDNSFGKGWWKVRCDHKSDEHSPKLKNSDRKKLIKDTRARNSSRFDSTDSSQIGTGNNCTKIAHTKDNSNADDFGSGWWNGLKKGTKRKLTSDETDRTDNVSTRKVSSQSSSKTKESSATNTCLHVVPYKSKKTEAMALRFAKVASILGSDLIKQEVLHGRIIRISLGAVPGLWKASLGGSRVSLLAEIIAPFPANQPAVLIQDINGHTAPVLLNTIYTAKYAIAQLQYAFNALISKCLKPGTFILVRKVNWQELSNKNLAIVMNDMDLVDFIFWDLIEN